MGERSSIAAPLLSFRKESDYAAFHDLLISAGYTEPEVLRTLGSENFRGLRSVSPELLQLRAGGSLPLNILIRLFLLEKPVSLTDFKKAVNPFPVDKFSKAGLIAVRRDSVIPRIRLHPFEEMILAHDLRIRSSPTVTEDFVMGVGDSSILLMNGTIRGVDQTTLDLGTGCGIQGLRAARHSRKVVATDLNARAVNICSFNAALNGVTNLDARTGSLFDSVEPPAAFDLIISNPPFVISPDNRLKYRDGGMETDKLCETIVRSAPRYMNEGGYCQLLCNWIEGCGENGETRLARWFANNGCDALVLRMEKHDPESYAAIWITHTERAEPETTEERLREWVRYYQKHKIESVNAGLITMRHRSNYSNWFRLIDASTLDVWKNYSSFILREFEVADFLHKVPDNSLLLDMPLRASPDLVLWQKNDLSEGKWRTGRYLLSLQRETSVSFEIIPFVAEIIAGCDGQRTVREVYTRVAGGFGLEIGRIPRHFADKVRSLVERGVLIVSSMHA